MAQVVAIGQPVNAAEREAIAYLRDHLPNTFTVIHNFELKQGHEVHEIDVALLGPHCVHVIDVKGTRGHVDVHGGRWYPEGRAPYHSPLAILRRHAKVLKALIRDRHPTDRALGGLYVDAAVLMTAPDAFVQDPGGQDGPAVTYLKKCAAFFQSAARIPPGRSTDVRAHHRHVRQAIVGRAKPKSAPPCYGTWQVEERLGGTNRYTEHRAKHTLLGATARLRVYPVDPYLPEDERRRERRRIENAYRAVAALPGHPNVLTVRDFFPTEAEDRFVLVTADVPGHALRQHVRKSALALTFDQKIAVVRDVLAALGHAHRSEPQVVHRNLTPDAVLVDASGRALLCGFDHARAGGGGSSTTIAGDVVDELDPTYQAPECYQDPSQASVASDLYAAGLVFYELLVGEPAWSSVDDMMGKDGVFPMKPSEQQPELPPAFDEWLQGLCAFDAEDRPSSAAVALARFNEIVGSDPRDGDGEAGARESAAAPAARPEVDYAALRRGEDFAGRFRVEERLGQGGFAVVYRMFDALADTSRVLKIIVKDRHSTFERLKREYSVLEGLPLHPNVVRVVWAELRDDTPYLVFEYVPGTGVNKRLDAGPLAPEDVKRLGTDTLAGLGHLHRNGVFHRDIKPSNLLWTDRGVLIIDFNVAARGDDDDEARPGGTRRYVPPDLELTEEMTEAEKTDWDLFSLGVTLYECATGKYPWRGDTPIAGVAPTEAGDCRGDLAPAFARVLMRAIAPRRADRFASAAAFRNALAAAVSVPEPAPDAGPGDVSSVVTNLPRHDCDVFRADFEPRRGPGFFPGAGGYFHGCAPAGDRRIVFFGTDFGTEKYWEEVKDGDGERATQPTLRELRKLVDEACVDPCSCHLTNAVLALARTDSNVGNERIYKQHPKYLRKCADFHREWISSHAPGLVVLMGGANARTYLRGVFRHVFQPIFPTLEERWRAPLTSIYENGRELVRQPEGPDVLCMFHPSYRNLNPRFPKCAVDEERKRREEVWRRIVEHLSRYG